ncbi:putative S-adenosylmethionine-dependent methyltransferase [Aspergillus stella-maris]|uniref:putative S-adenosylmethionine-dependent methyltransferase n=1 Tax=Aspergillus stella-maris TaxID=1810926 RepID=UPI003CCD4E65
MAENTSSESHPTHLSPSELGTKEYWETFYTRTLTHISSKRDATTESPADAAEQNEASDADFDSEDDDYNGDSDPGTSWFSEHNAPQKVLSFLTDESFPLAPVNTLPTDTSTSTSGRSGRRKKGTPLPPAEKGKQPSILDLGTGNGSMLALLRKRGGFAGNMVGVDYSAKSVELARELQERRGHEAYQTDSEDEDESDFGDDDEQDTEQNSESQWDPIVFEEWDILSPSTPNEISQKRNFWFPYKTSGFDIVLDKGTFDAISLMAEKDGTEKYPSIAGGLVRRGGFLVVTSCNWTEEEVVRWFTRGEVVDLGLDGDGNGPSKLVVWGRVQYPRFRFGGQEGQGVCTVCFQRV